MIRRAKRRPDMFADPVIRRERTGARRTEQIPLGADLNEVRDAAFDHGKEGGRIDPADLDAFLREVFVTASSDAGRESSGYVSWDHPES